MGKTGRPRHPDILTPREWEVLALLRERRTNEEIASRLDITLDGAKYHVSQILSKLGVATREEAATVALGERRAWWARWPVWTKIAGAATMVAAVVALAFLAWGVARTGSGDNEDKVSVDPAVSELHDRIREAIDRPGLVLHTTARGSLLGPEQTDASDWLELWIDGSEDVARRRLNVDPTLGSRPDGLIGIYQEEEWFSLMDDGRVGKFEVDARMLCPGSQELLLALLLECNLAPSADMEVSELEATPPYVGGPAIVITAVQADEF